MDHDNALFNGLCLRARKALTPASSGWRCGHYLHQFAQDYWWRQSAFDRTTGSFVWLHGGKSCKRRFRGGGEIIRPFAPGEAQPAGVQGVVGQEEAGALGVGEPAFDQGQIQVGVAAVEFVAHDGVAQVREMDADLMFAAGQREQP